MHFKFVNAIASYAQSLNLHKEHEHSAYRFHQDMFASGIERILAVSPGAHVLVKVSLIRFPRSRGKRRQHITRRFISRSHDMSGQQGGQALTSLGHCRE